MKINVEVISKEMIKPSTPTPDHLRHYQVSFLDQTAPSVYISLTYFFHLANDDKRITSNKDILNNLKSSLSNVLTKYYQLAGRIKNSYIDCNDEGVVFSEAKVSCQLSEIINEPELPRELTKLLPFDQENERDIDSAIAIQVNLFNCGTVAIAAMISHKIADGSSLITFMRNWAATARGDGENVRPEFVAASLFPYKDAGVNWDPSAGHSSRKKIALKRFVFEGSKIAALREKYGSDKEIYPTRVEALSAFIWSRLADSTQMKISPERPCLLVIHTVNLRKRMEQPLPDDSFGNIFAIAVTVLSENADDVVMVNKFRDSISKINKDYVKMMQLGHSELIEIFTKLGGKLDTGELSYCNFSSLCKFPVYDADFGWGKPMWVAWGCIPYKNIIILIDTKSGDGIEAWVHLEEEDMAKFQSDKELLAYVSI